MSCWASSATPPTPRSRLPIASSPSSGTRTSTPSPRPRSASRRSTRPTRSSAIPSAASATTCSGGPASMAPVARVRGSRASAASRTSSMRSSAAGPARRPRGAAVRSLAPTCATTCGSRSRRPSRAPRRRSSSASSSRATRAAETAPNPGPSRPPARSAMAAARSATSARRCSARWSTSAPVRAARARARSSRRPATPARARAGSRRSGRSGSRSRPASTRATRSASRTRARPARAAARPAACTSRSTSRRIRRSSAQGTELMYEAKISIAQAALGTKIKVPTVDGDEEVEVKAGTQPGTEIRLRGKGVPHLRRAGSRGDLHVMVDVVVPTKLTKRQRELLTELAAERRRDGPRVGRAAREARARVSPEGRRNDSTRRPEPMPGSRSPSRRTSKRSKPSARSSGGSRPAAWPSSRPSSSSTKGRGTRRSGPTGDGPGLSPGARSGRGGAGRSPRPRWRSVTSRRSACGRSVTSGRASSTRRTGPMPGRRSSRSCGSAGASSSDRRGDATGPDRTTWSSPSTRGWRSGPVSIRRPGCAWRRSSRWPIATALAGARVLDVGCGSGILAIAAVRLGAATALGVDTDPIAVEATAANARRNHLVRRIRTREGSVPTGDGRFDVVLANLIAGLLVPLAPAPPRRAAAGRRAPGVGHLHRPRGGRPDGIRGRRARRRSPDRGGRLDRPRGASAGLSASSPAPSGRSAPRPYNPP